MPSGKGTYGSKVGRPPKKAKKRRTSRTANDKIKSRLKSGKSKPALSYGKFPRPSDGAQSTHISPGLKAQTEHCIKPGVELHLYMLVGWLIY